MKHLPVLSVLMCLASVPAALWAEGSPLPFSRGVNLSAWFEAQDARSIRFDRYRRKDFIDLKALGVDVVRVPIRLHDLTSGAPDWKIDPLVFRYLDKVIDWAEEQGISIILDNHSFDPIGPTDPGIERVLIPVWQQMAQRYKGRSDRVIYEILNEPHGIDAGTWGLIQGKAIDAIRRIDDRHAIIVGGVDFNSYRALEDLPLYADANLIYTFHFYDPFLFTHQGASWVDPSMADVRDIPFPPESRALPPVPAQYEGTWVGTQYQNYRHDGDLRQLEANLDIPASFARERKVRLFCGEFGAFIPNARPEERAAWYKAIRTALEVRNIPWTMWDCRGGFGIFTKESGRVFPEDLNLPLLKVLGFNTEP